MLPRRCVASLGVADGGGPPLVPYLLVRVWLGVRARAAGGVWPYPRRILGGSAPFPLMPAWCGVLRGVKPRFGVECSVGTDVVVLVIVLERMLCGRRGF